MNNEENKKAVTLDDKTQFKFNLSQLYQIFTILISLGFAFLLLDRRLSGIDTKIAIIGTTLSGVYSKTEIDNLRNINDTILKDYGRRIKRIENRMGIREE